MELSYFHFTVLSLVQGATEFLPISSSAHLILPSILFGWSDQGLSFDVALHLGSLFAVIFYFRQEVLAMVKGLIRQLVRGEISEDSRLAWFIVVATIPGALAGFLASDYIESYARSGIVLAITSVVFALLLWYSDRIGLGERTLSELNWQHAFFLGIAQALALIPGTSRSGITMTAALFCHLPRQTAAKISFLMAIPIIFGSFLLRSAEMLGSGTLADQLIPMLYGITISGIVAFASIHFFIRLIERIGFLPFVIYRIGLAFVIFLVTLAA